MLEQVLRHLHNWFICPDGIHLGIFTVENGELPLDFLQTGQYFRIVGSVFNDGLYCHGLEYLTDESFEGAVWALAVPKAVVELSEEISAWQEKNAEAESSPYTSESFGGYSYTKATNSKGLALTWKDVFRSRLNQWRKL